MGARESAKPELGEEFSGLELGDARLVARARKILARIGVAPDDSFPEQMETLAEREALYRFLSNPAVTLDRLLESHVAQAHERMRSHSTVRVLHDTTDFKFEGEREGLEVISRASRGFFAHVALAVGADELREPLGVLGVRTHLRQDAVAHRGLSRTQRVDLCRKTERSKKSSSRWEALAIDVSRALPANVRAVHIMDQEADDYALMAALEADSLRFVVRVSPERLLESGGPSVANALRMRCKETTSTFRTVAVNARTAKKTGGVRPVRAEREASLVVRWGRVTIHYRRYVTQSDVTQLDVNAVHVFEPNPPAGEEALEWMLFTSEPIESLAEVTEVVDHYRARWVIEEYFKALKTGCAFEKRQLTTFDGLLRALGLFIPVAWKLLALRNLGRQPEARPASHLFDHQTLLLLRAMLKERRYNLPSSPTLRDAMLAVAALGGHIKNNGDPGWIVLGRGLTRLLDAEVGWRLARQM